MTTNTSTIEWNPAFDDDPGFAATPADLAHAPARAGAHEPPRTIDDVVALLTAEGWAEIDTTTGATA